MGAVRGGQLETARYFAGKCGADVNAKNEDENTALVQVARLKSYGISLTELAQT